MIHTTFRKLHEAGACTERYKFLAKALGGIKTYGKDTPITLLQILDRNGLNDALWALRACDDSREFNRLLGCEYAEHVLHIYEALYPDDGRPRRAIEVIRKYAIGEATVDEWAAAWYDAKVAARDAAWDAARYAARAAAGDAAWAASWAAAWAASKAAARDASAVDAWCAERRWQGERLRKILEEMEE